MAGSQKGQQGEGPEKNGTPRNRKKGVPKDPLMGEYAPDFLGNRVFDSLTVRRLGRNGPGSSPRSRSAPRASTLGMAARAARRQRHPSRPSGPCGSASVAGTGASRTSAAGRGPASSGAPYPPPPPRKRA